VDDGHRLCRAAADRRDVHGDPQQFFPDTDNDFSTITIDMVPGTTIEQTEQKVDEVLALVKDQPDLGVALERIREGSGRVFLN
jgi:multidrug efflux pump subunit AcrB